MTNDIDAGALAPGRIVHGIVIEHHAWGIELQLEEVNAFGMVDLRFLSDDPEDVNIDKYPKLGVRLRAVVQGMTPNGQLRLTIRSSDLGRAEVKDSPTEVITRCNTASQPPDTQFLPGSLQ